MSPIGDKPTTDFADLLNVLPKLRKGFAKVAESL